MYRINEPQTRTVQLRTPLMRQWAMECLRDFNIHRREGADWVIVHVSMNEATMQRLVRVQITPRKPNSNRCACGCIDLIRYSSLNMKQCPDCKTEIPWDLAPGQLPLVGSSRQDRKIPVDESVSHVNNGPIEAETPR